LNSSFLIVLLNICLTIPHSQLNPELTPFQRRYVAQVKRCDDLERKLRFFASECDKFDLQIESAGDVDEFIAHSRQETPLPNANGSSTVVSPPPAAAFSSIQEEEGSIGPGSVVFDQIDEEFYDKMGFIREDPVPASRYETESVTSTQSTTMKSSDTKLSARFLEVLDAKLDVYEKQLKELNLLAEKLTVEYNESIELQEVLTKARNFFMIDTPRLANLQLGDEADDEYDEENGLDVPLLEEDGGPSHKADELKFSYITGVVATDERNSFERIIFRSTRGNCFVRFATIAKPIVDPYSTMEVEKSVFIIFYQSRWIEEKLIHICDAFTAHRYYIPDLEDIPAVDKRLKENNQLLNEANTVLVKNHQARYDLCQELSQQVERWTWSVLQEKAIYHSLNMFKSDVAGMLRGEGWVVADKLPMVIDSINKAHENMDSSMGSIVEHVPKPWPTPPTHFGTNKFTYGYQEFVNTYGIPRYREANPALFTAATFPFLFGVMYGDIGHGLFLFCVGLTLLYNEKKNDKAKLGEMAGGMHAGRYMLTMMGFFAIYAGFIYNDCFSLGLNLFGSRFLFDGQEDDEVVDGEIANNLAPYGTDASVYPFGLDPIWKVASNDLLFFNSFKMKISVTFGIVQMFMGTILKGMNAIYFREPLDFFFEFIPMIVFASSLFVYMIILIFYKWSIDWNARMLSATCLDPTGPEWESIQFDSFNWVVCDTTVGNGLCTPWGYSCTGKDTTADKCPLDFGGTGDGCQPPNLITTLINIALAPGAVDEPMYGGQANTQNILLFLALISVPTLLCAKPYFLSKQHSSSHAHEDENGELDTEFDGDHDGEHSFGEIFIHQAIETIEFVLGMVSNTASYLRLWALSLAHSELAEVFWEKAFLVALNLNWFYTYLSFAVFAGVTFGVLLAMDVLECFLHALRLHWVEFQNKFFKADGVAFAPYSFKKLLDSASSGE